MFASIYRVAVDSYQRVIGYQPVSAPGTIIRLPRELSYEEGLPTILQSLEPYYKFGASLPSDPNTHYYCNNPDLQRYLNSPQGNGSLLGRDYLPPALRFNNDIFIKQAHLVDVLKNEVTRQRGRDLFLCGRKYAFICDVSEVLKYIVEQSVRFCDDSYNLVRKEEPIAEGSKVISVCGQLLCSQPPHYVDAVPPCDALLQSPEAVQSFIDFQPLFEPIFEPIQTRPNLNSNHEALNYLPSGEENLVRLKRMASDSGGKGCLLLGLV